MGKWKNGRWRQRMCLHLWAQKNVYHMWREFTHIFLPCLSHTRRHAQKAVYARKGTIKLYFFQLSPFRFVHRCIMSLFQCCQSSLYGFPPRLWYSTLTSTKARTVCQPEAPCRPAAAEVRNKENMTVCVALKKTSRSPIQACQNDWVSEWYIRDGTLMLANKL